MTVENTDEIIVSAATALTETMQTIDKSGAGLVAVVDDDGRFRGIATDGDIRRGILDGIDIDAPVREVINEDPLVLRTSDGAEALSDQLSAEDVQRRTSVHEVLMIPVLDENDRIVELEYVNREGRVLTNRTAADPTRNVQTVLVIGGAGYIGSVLSRRLLEAGYEVRVLDSLLYGRHGIEALLDHDRFTLIEGDMRTIDTVVEGIRGADAVVHLGALVGDPASSIDSQKTLEMNYHAVTLAASICKYHQVNRFIFASTCSVYGRDENDDLLTEASALNPVSLYAKTKIESEQALLEMADANFSPTILRMATIYGLSPRMRFDLVVNILTAKAHETGDVPVFGGNQFRPNVHVADAAGAFIDCLEAPINDVSSEVFNVGSTEQNYRIAEVGEMIAECFPEASIEWHPENEDERSYRVDFSKIESTLDYDVERTIPDGCREIKEALEESRFSDYTDPRYSNYKTLESDRHPFPST
ncbi:NAD-dependent epimerase/dehydratase family protein [Halosolutus amylolyticus]|uniref:NAD-dependent epimerase/dehydratase family protein n=1 Tax=Halosolutus amylolyticus TaxID=2932267 RepID=A0ABD5PNN9_9EURY|nr:NAD-dependent epimerase/dehydratase family protein [Halosolutus amylolyticus]